MLLQFIRRKPFEPFVVELFDGQLIEIPTPRVIVGGGAATHIGPDFEMVDSVRDEVCEIRSWYIQSGVPNGRLSCHDRWRI